MKKFLSSQNYQIAALIAGTLYFLLNGFIPREEEKAEQYGPVIIWNDDIEAIPADGQKVVIEYTKNDTIYIGTIEANQ